MIVIILSLIISVVFLYRYFYQSVEIVIKKEISLISYNMFSLQEEINDLEKAIFEQKKMLQETTIKQKVLYNTFVTMRKRKHDQEISNIRLASDRKIRQISRFYAESLHELSRHHMMEIITAYAKLYGETEQLEKSNIKKISNILHKK